MCVIPSLSRDRAQRAGSRERAGWWLPLDKLGVTMLAALLLLWTLPLEGSAQTPAPQDRTITATGMGNASGPVTGAVVMAVLKGPVDAAGLQKALSQAGVADFIDDRSPLTTLNPSAVGLRGRLPGATHQDIDAVVQAVKAYVDSRRGASIVALRFFGPATDCDKIVGEARKAAFADAQARAAEIAGNIGARVGSVVSVVEHGACPPPGPLGGAYAIDPQTLEMTVPVQESVTYAVLPT